MNQSTNTLPHVFAPSLGHTGPTHTVGSGAARQLLWEPYDIPSKIPEMAIKKNFTLRFFLLQIELHFDLSLPWEHWWASWAEVYEHSVQWSGSLWWCGKPTYGIAHTQTPGKWTSKHTQLELDCSNSLIKYIHWPMSSAPNQPKKFNWFSMIVSDSKTSYRIVYVWR